MPTVTSENREEFIRKELEKKSPKKRDKNKLISGKAKKMDKPAINVDEIQDRLNKAYSKMENNPGHKGHSDAYWSARDELHSALTNK